jgi:hypothetical protein
MKRYDSTNTIRVVVPPEQKEWLRSKATGMQTISDVIRRLIKQSMELESRGVLPATGYREQA